MRARFVLTVGILVMACGSLLAQTAAPAAADNAVPTFHVTSRLVLVDVVVTGKHGDFVRNLKPADFTLLEDGKPQKISAFSAHLESGQAQPAPQIHLPPHQYTNFTAVAPDHPISIVLFDMLNTEFMDRPYARQQMIKFLASMPAGQPVALFVLGEKLRMVQGFTQSSDALVAAAKGITDKNENAHLMTGQQERDDAAGIDEKLAEAAGGLVPASTASLSQAMDAVDVYQTEVRIRSTLISLQALAKMVAGYTGRKNLIWLSGDFPIAFGPDSRLAFGASTTRSPHNSPEINSGLWGDELQRTSALLASSQVAVYPIDLRGFQTNTGGASFMGGATTAISQARQQTTARWNTQFTMNDIAKETGGEAFYNQNDLGGLMRRSLDEGTNYYTLAYVPQDHDWNSRYRKIEVKLAVESTKLRYRNGYYAVPDQPTEQKDAARMLALAMQPSVPESTRLLLRVEVLPPDASRKTVSIDFAVNPSDLIFVDGPEQRKQSIVDFMAIALDNKLKESGVASNTVNASLRPETYQQVLKTGFPGHLEIELKPGKYLLRLGAIDRNSEKIGTVDVPVTVPGPDTAAK